MAITFAVVAVVMSFAAVIVVVTRSGSGAPAPDAAARGSGSGAVTPGPVEREVDATELVRLDPKTVERVTEGGVVAGVKVTDAAVRAALGLEADDVLTALAGRAIKREFDVYEAVLGMSMMDTSIVYVDVRRGDAPALLKWRVKGDLRRARREQSGGRLPRDPGGAFGGTLSTTPPPDLDPLLGTIKKLDELTYELPQATVDRLLADPAAFARGARIMPAFKYGQQEGYKLYAIRPSSVWSALGFSNGDTIRAVNGRALDGAADVLEVVDKLKSEKVFKFELTRRGDAKELVISVK